MDQKDMARRLYDYCKQLDRAQRELDKAVERLHYAQHELKTAKDSIGLLQTQIATGEN